MIALFIAAAFWLAAYALFGWYGVLVMAVLGTIGELVLFGSYELQRFHARRVARRRFAGWKAHDRYRRLVDRR